MRHILVDHARMRGAARRGGNSLTMVLDEAVALPAEREVNVVALDDALNRWRRWMRGKRRLSRCVFSEGYPLKKRLPLSICRLRR